MAQINKPTDYFNTLLWSGTGASNSLTGVGFQPDWTWIKKRSNVADHRIFDSVRGATKALKSNATQAEGTETQALTSFDSDGFTLGTDDFTNGSGSTFVGWNWLAGGTASSNTDGSITSSVSANTTSGFSIVSYTGTGSNATVGHGLSSAPDMIFFKNRSSAVNWSVYARPNGAGYGQFLNTTAGKDLDSSYFNDTDPTTSVFSVGTNSFTNGSGNNMIAYCFSSTKGYSKIGSYTGNGSTDGTFVYTGMRPAFVIIKASSTVEDWGILDNKRSTSGANVIDDFLYANQSFAESSAQTPADFLSNGFKLRNTDSKWNGSGVSYIYMCFSENPLVGTNNVVGCAR